MRSARLDARVRREARILAREAHAALRRQHDPGDPGGPSGALASAVQTVDEALAARDYRRVRQGLPALDVLVDELSERPGKSMTRDYVESIGAAILIAFALRAMVLEAFKIPSSSMYPTLEVNDHIFVNKFLYGIHVPFTTTKLGTWRKPQRGEVIVFLQPCTPDKDYIKRVIATEGQTVEVRCNVVYVDGQPIEHRLVQGEGCSYEDQPEDSNQWYTRGCSEYVERVGDHAYHTYYDPDRPMYDAELATQRSLASAELGSAIRNDFPRLDTRMAPHCSTLANGEPFASPNQRPGKVVESKRDAGVCEQQLHFVVPAGHVFVMGDNRDNSNDSRFWGSVPIENIRGKALVTWLSYRDFDLDLHWKLWTSRPTFELRWDRIGNFVK